MSDLRSEPFKSRSPVKKVGKSDHDKKLFYCEICEVPCPTPVHLQDHFKGKSHKQKERAIMYGGFKVEELERIIKKVKCLKDYVDETEREPLIGLEYVVEFRHPEMEEPDYECELCESKSKLVPLIVHLNGLKHRKAYISRHYPFSAKTRDPKEDIFQFLRRMAFEIERYRGLKEFRVDPPLKNESEGSLAHEPSNRLKRSRWDVDYLSDFESKRRRPEVFQEEMDKVLRGNRADEVLGQGKQRRSNSENRDVSPLASRGAFETDEFWDREDRRRSYSKEGSESRDRRNIGQKEPSIGEIEEWKRFFLGGSSAEKAAWAETLQKNQTPWKSSSDSGRWSPPPNRNKYSPGASADDRTVSKNVDEDYDRSQKSRQRGKNGFKESRSQDYSSSRKKKESAEEAQKRAEAHRKAEAEKRAEVEKRVAAEKQAQAERVARAKKVAEALTRGVGAQTKTTQKEQVKVAAVSDPTVVKIDEEKLAQARRVAEAIAQTINKPGTGKLKSTQNKPDRKPTGDPSMKQATAEKLAQANRGGQGGGIWNRESAGYEAEINSGLQQDILKQKPLPWRQAQTVSAPVKAQTVPAPIAAPCLPEESVVDLLENFLKQSLGEEGLNSFHEGSENWNQDSRIQDQPPQYVTSGTWNLVPIAQKQQIQQAIGRGNWKAESYVLETEAVQRAAKARLYDQAVSSHERLSLNPLRFQTTEHPSLYGTQANHSDVRHLAPNDSRGPGNFSSGNRVFEYDQPSSMVYPSIRGGTDYQTSSLYRNDPQRAGANRMSADNWQLESASLNMRDLPNQASVFQSSQGYATGSSSNYSNLPQNRLQGNMDRAPRSSGDSYRDGVNEMVQNRAMAQKSTFRQW